VNPTATFVVGIIGSGLLTVVGIYAVALQRGPSAGSVAMEETEHLKGSNGIAAEANTTTAAPLR